MARGRIPTPAVIAAGGIGALVMLGVGGWFWSRRLQSGIDARTRDRLVPETARGVTPSAADIHVAGGR